MLLGRRVLYRGYNTYREFDLAGGRCMDDRKIVCAMAFFWSSLFLDGQRSSSIK